MRILVCVLTSILSYSVFAAADDDIGSSVNTDDICAVRPDLCGGSRTRHKKKIKRANASSDMDFADFDADHAKRPDPKRSTQVAIAHPKKEDLKKKKKKKSSADPLADFWDRNEELVSDQKEIKLLDVERAPASEIKPVIALEPAAVRKRISFDTYINSNSSNSALSGRIAGRQDAFQQTARPAILTAPTSSDVATNAAPVNDATAGNGQSVRENQPAAPPANPTPHP